MELILFYVLALLAGATAPVQAGINAQLRESWAGDSVNASFISFLVGTVVLGLWIGASRLMASGAVERAAGSIPVTWWHFSGGALGAFFVAMMVFLSWRLGATSMFALVVAGQLIASLALDHYGILGYPVQEVNWQRMLGVALLVAGAVLVRR